MQWKDVTQFIGKTAPMVGTLLGGPAGGVIGAMVSSVLGVEDDPDKVIEALKTDPNAIIKIKELEMKHEEELQKMQLEYAKAQILAEQEKLNTVNETIRAEMKQDDLYTKRWRPTMGYAVVLTWVLSWISIVYVVIFNTKDAQKIIQAFAETTVLWSVALSVLGIYVYKRTEEKQIFAGMKPEGFLSMFKGKK